jgi:hypothetical protein
MERDGEGWRGMEKEMENVQEMRCNSCGNGRR